MSLRRTTPRRLLALRLLLLGKPEDGPALAGDQVDDRLAPGTFEIGYFYRYLWPWLSVAEQAAYLATLR